MTTPNPGPHTPPEKWLIHSPQAIHHHPDLDALFDAPIVAFFQQALSTPQVPLNGAVWDTQFAHHRSAAKAAGQSMRVLSVAVERTAQHPVLRTPLRADPDVGVFSAVGYGPMGHAGLGGDVAMMHTVFATKLATPPNEPPVWLLALASWSPRSGGGQPETFPAAVNALTLAWTAAASPAEWDVEQVRTDGYGPHPETLFLYHLTDLLPAMDGRVHPVVASLKAAVAQMEEEDRGLPSRPSPRRSRRGSR